MLRLEDVIVRQGEFTLSVSLDVPKGARGALMGAAGAGRAIVASLNSLINFWQKTPTNTSL